MKKNLLALVAFSGIVFTSCSNEMDQMVEQQKEKNVIGFSTYSMMSKGKPIINNGAFAKDGSSFEVAAFLNDKTNPYLQAQITHNGTSWNYFNSLDKAYWPNGADDKLNFFAVAPYSDFYPAAEGGKSAKGTVAYTNNNMVINYTVPTTTLDQQDLMYATTAPMAKQSEGKVTLNFKHALNQIHFKGRTDSKNLKVIINPMDGIQVCNVYGSAEGTVAQGDQSVIAWSYTGKDAKQVFNNVTPTTEPLTDIVINTTPESGESVSLTNPSDILMLLPQPKELLVWAPAPTTPQTGSAEKTGSYLKISCKLIALSEDGKIELAYLYGTADKFADMYVPFNCSAMEASGKKITYTLIFGGGYNNEGQPILTPITFDTTVQDWIDDPKVDNPKQPLN